MNTLKTETIETSLQRKHGALIGAPALSQLLGYRTTNALRQASRRGQLGIQLFSIEHRRGLFAFTADVARWFENLRVAAETQHANPGAADPVPPDERGNSKDLEGG